MNEFETRRGEVCKTSEWMRWGRRQFRNLMNSLKNFLSTITYFMIASSYLIFRDQEVFKFLTQQIITIHSRHEILTQDKERLSNEVQ